MVFYLTFSFFFLSDVPQGSVLGLRVFTMYTRPFGIIVLRYGTK